MVERLLTEDSDGFYRHLSPIALLLHAAVRTEQGLNIQVVSGFTAIIGLRQYFVTAGHALLPVAEQHKLGSLVTTRFEQMLDNPPAGGNAFPFAFDPKNMLAVDTVYAESETGQAVPGVDFAVYVLGLIERSCLAAGKAKSIDGRRVAHPRKKFHCYVLIGSPGWAREQSIVRSGSSSRVAVQNGMMMLPLRRRPIPRRLRKAAFRYTFEPVGIPPDEHKTTSGDWNVEGMSGGPVFGINVRRGKFQIEFVGIQSTQMPVDGRTVLNVFPGHEIFRKLRQASRRIDVQSAS